MILDAEKNVWCPACRVGAGEPCKATKAATREYLGEVGKARQAGQDPPSLRIKLHVDHDGETEVHLQRIHRADALADGLAQWRRDELFSLVAAVVGELEAGREVDDADLAAAILPQWSCSCGWPVGAYGDRCKACCAEARHEAGCPWPDSDAASCACVVFGAEAAESAARSEPDDPLCHVCEAPAVYDRTLGLFVCGAHGLVQTDGVE